MNKDLVGTRGFRAGQSGGLEDSADALGLVFEAVETASDLPAFLDFGAIGDDWDGPWISRLARDETKLKS